MKPDAGAKYFFKKYQLNICQSMLICKFRLNGTAVPRQRRGHSVLNGAKRRLVDSYKLHRFPHALSVHF